MAAAAAIAAGAEEEKPLMLEPKITRCPATRPALEEGALLARRRETPKRSSACADMVLGLITMF